MSRQLFISARLAGAFCTAFTIAAGILTEALGMLALLGLSALSGFGGRVFAHLVFERRRQ
jgi:hypothetical protein